MPQPEVFAALLAPAAVALAPRDFQIEGGNGYLLLTAILDLLGPEAFAKGTQEALTPRTGLVQGRDLLDAYEKHTPADKLDVLHRLFVSKVEGYSP